MFGRNRQTSPNPAETTFGRPLPRNQISEREQILARTIAERGRAPLDPELRTRPRAASRWHAVVWFAWAISGVAVIQIAPNPLYVALTIGVAALVAAVCNTGGPYASIFRLLLIASVLFSLFRVVLAGLTVHGEGPVLFTLPTFTVPEILGGFEVGGEVDASTLSVAATQAFVVVGIIALFATFNACVSHHEIVAAIPRAYFELGVAVGVALTFFPSIVDAVNDVSESDRARTGGRVVKKRRLRRLLMPLLENALERSVLLAEAIDSRGFGRGNVPNRERLSAWSGLFSVLLVGGAFVGLVARQTTTSVVLLVAGFSCLVFAGWAGASGAPRAFRRRQVTRADMGLIVVVGAAPLLVGSASILGASSLTWPAERLELPMVEPIPVLAIALLLAPLIRHTSALRRSP